MNIGIIQGTTQADKNAVLFDTTQKIAAGYQHEVFNFGVTPHEATAYSYTEIAFLIALLINSRVVDFVITGCSSGQGMNLACNALPGLLSGFIQNPQDAFLFGRINDGNVASLSLGLGYGWLGELNLEYTLEKLFDGEFGIGYPKDVAERKIRETKRVKYLNSISKRSMTEVLNTVDKAFLNKILLKTDVIDFILSRSGETELTDFLRTNRS